VKRVEFPAMGTEVEAWCDEANVAQLREWFEQVEQVCSRFRHNSELSQLNRDPAPPRTLGGMLHDVIHAGSRAFELSDGLVDIGVGSAVKAWGYDCSFESVTDLACPPVALSPSAWRLEGALLHRIPGVSLDLGGIAKGWSSDRAIDQGLAMVVSAGGDLRSAHPDTTASVVDLEGSVVARVHVGLGALATSSIGRRRWRVGGIEVSHLIDPRTMEPADTPVISATVLADTAVDAETGAKVVLLLGADGLAWAAEQTWISAAMVIWNDGSVFATSGLEVAA
jgi:thiamine biosynthesis lipoprotein